MTISAQAHCPLVLLLRNQCLGEKQPQETSPRPECQLHLHLVCFYTRPLAYLSIQSSSPPHQSQEDKPGLKGAGPREAPALGASVLSMARHRLGSSPLPCTTQCSKVSALEDPEQAGRSCICSCGRKKQGQLTVTGWKRLGLSGSEAQPQLLSTNRSPHKRPPHAAHSLSCLLLVPPPEKE